MVLYRTHSTRLLSKTAYKTRLAKCAISAYFETHKKDRQRGIETEQLCSNKQQEIQLHIISNIEINH